jgi:hypothetical protein
MQKSDMQQMQQPQIDLSKTTPINTENGGNVWKQGFVLRKVSRFITNSSEDAVLPIPVFYDKASGKILAQSLPQELRDEYDTI